MMRNINIVRSTLTRRWNVERGTDQQKSLYKKFFTLNGNRNRRFQMVQKKSFHDDKGNNNNDDDDDDDDDDDIQRGNDFSFPQPTWSLKDLKLTAKDQDNEQEGINITDEELKILSRRCLINVDHFSPEKRKQLKADLANIMTCTSLLCNLNLEKFGDDLLKEDETIYDSPRFGGAQINHSAGLQNENLDEWESRDRVVAEKVLQNIEKQGKLITNEGESYFKLDSTIKK